MRVRLTIVLIKYLTMLTSFSHCICTNLAFSQACADGHTLGEALHLPYQTYLLMFVPTQLLAFNSQSQDSKTTFLLEHPTDQ